MVRDRGLFVNPESCNSPNAALAPVCRHASTTLFKQFKDIDQENDNGLSNSPSTPSTSLTQASCFPSDGSPSSLAVARRLHGFRDASDFNSLAHAVDATADLENDSTFLDYLNSTQELPTQRVTVPSVLCSPISYPRLSLDVNVSCSSEEHSSSVLSTPGCPDATAIKYPDLEMLQANNITDDFVSKDGVSDSIFSYDTKEPASSLDPGQQPQVAVSDIRIPQLSALLSNCSDVPLSEHPLSTPLSPDLSVTRVKHGSNSIIQGPQSSKSLKKSYSSHVKNEAVDFSRFLEISPVKKVGIEELDISHMKKVVEAFQKNRTSSRVAAAVNIVCFCITYFLR